MKYIELKNGKKWNLNEAYNGDCLDFMALLPDKCIDLVLTDPPYGIGFDKENNSMSCGMRKDGSKRNYNKWSNPEPKGYATKDWDSKIPEKEIFEEIFRVSKKQMIWGGNYFSEYLPPSGGWVVWDKKVVMPTLSKGELAWHNCDNHVEIFQYLYAGFRKEIQEDRFHPTQKPLKLFKWCLEKYAPENTIVFDPFLGSFTTAVACHSRGLNWIGCEKDEDYFKAGLERYETECLQNLMDFGS